MAVADEGSVALVDALGELYGRHPGHRAAHAKGTLCAATFTPTPAARGLSRAAHLQGDAVRAHVRFSNGSGDPGASDTARDGRGMAVKFYLPDGHTTDIVALTLPVFFTRTPEDLIAFNHARAPDPGTGEPDLARVGAFLEEHPETMAAIQHALSARPPASYLQVAYHGIHAFCFEGPEGRRFGRYDLLPREPIATLDDEQAQASAPDYLQQELADHLQRGPARFGLEVALAEDGDPIDDPTAPWPAERERVQLGDLEITGLAFDRERDGDVLVFDPTRVTDGIGLSDDRILLARPGAYSVSVARRTGAAPPA
jgi:catalase